MSTAAIDEVVYLDRNATTPVAPGVLEAMLPYLRTAYGNPLSDHALGRRARHAVDEARAAVAALIGAGPASPRDRLPVPWRACRASNGRPAGSGRQRGARRRS